MKTTETKTNIYKTLFCGPETKEINLDNDKTCKAADAKTQKQLSAMTDEEKWNYLNAMFSPEAKADLDAHNNHERL